MPGTRRQPYSASPLLWHAWHWHWHCATSTSPADHPALLLKRFQRSRGNSRPSPVPTSRHTFHLYALDATLPRASRGLQAAPPASRPRVPFRCLKYAVGRCFDTGPPCPASLLPALFSRPCRHGSVTTHVCTVRPSEHHLTPPCNLPPSLRCHRADLEHGHALRRQSRPMVHACLWYLVAATVRGRTLMLARPILELGLRDAEAALQPALVVE